MEMIARCKICKAILQVNEEGEYICVNDAIHKASKELLTQCLVESWLDVEVLT